MKSRKKMERSNYCRKVGSNYVAVFNSSALKSSYLVWILSFNTMFFI